MYLPYLLKKYFKQSEPAEVSVVTTEMSMMAKEEYSDERCEDEADFLEISPGYSPEESVHYMTSGSNLIEELQAEFMDLVNQFSSLFTNAPSSAPQTWFSIMITNSD